MPQIFQSTVNEICKVNYAELPEQIKDWITEHPHQTTFHVFNGIVFFYPGLIPGPILWSLGWTSTGPRPGSPAAALMARFGIIPSRGILATLQSAGMGGYGTALVDGGTRAASAAVLASDWLYWVSHGAESSRAKDSAGCKTSHEAEVEADSPLKLKAKL